MTEDEPCCGLVAGGPSPFELAMVLGWWDGPLDGLARCRRCRSAYHFQMLTWDDQQTVRVYALARVSTKGYERALALYALPATSVEESQQRSDAIERAIHEALGYSERMLIVASIELGESILAAREISMSVWRSILGLP